MTEEIINDGVDVSKCKWHTNLKMDCLELPTQPFKCANDTNCYFKQLKRKEQECENQRQRLEYYIEKTTQLLNDIDNKDRFNAELQELNSDNRYFVNMITSLKLLTDRYEQALDEIEKIVSADYYDDSWGTLAIKIDSIKGKGGLMFKENVVRRLVTEVVK